MKKIALIGCGDIGIGSSIALRHALMKHSYRLVIIDDMCSFEPVNQKQDMEVFRKSLAAYRQKSPFDPEPFIITAPKRPEINASLFKGRIDCRKGHSYERYEQEKSKNYFIVTHKCKCGKQL